MQNPYVYHAQESLNATETHLNETLEAMLGALDEQQLWIPWEQLISRERTLVQLFHDARERLDAIQTELMAYAGHQPKMVDNLYSSASQLKTSSFSPIHPDDDLLRQVRWW